MPLRIAETILSALTQPVLVLDGTLRAVVANPAFYEMLNIFPGLLVGKSVQELIAGERGASRLRPILETVVAHDSNVQSAEIECTIPPDTQKILAVNARRVIVGDDLAEMVLVEIRDVSQERKTERKVHELNEQLIKHGSELEEINKELETFTHSASHDLRTPLRLTNKIAHMLLQEHGAELSTGASEKVQMILDSTHQMGKLIEDLLAFSRITREPIRKRRIDVGRLVREALDDLKDEREGRDVDVVIEEVPPCQADRALLKQVFLNLLANALKFTRPREKAEICVGFTQSKAQNVYFVRDNGVGFDMSRSDTLFVAFRRLHTAQNFEGSGVGLALVKRIVERHDGRIWAKAEAGRGATFYFTLGQQTAV